MGEWLYEDALRNEMEKDVVVMEDLVPLTRENGCHYIIFRPDQEVVGRPEDYDWVRFVEAEGYVVYRDLDVELVIPNLD